MYGFTYTPKTEAELLDIKNSKLLKDGNYPFIVKSLANDISNAGNSQLKLIIGIKDEKGFERNITDYFGSSDTMAFKLKHYCDAVGLEDEYSRVAVQEIIQKSTGRSGIAKIGIKKGSMRQDNTPFDDSNVVRDYFKGTSVQKKPVEIAPSLNDDIAF